MSLALAAPDLFDQPSLWRWEGAACLGLTGHDLVAAMSPGPAFPAALRSLRSAMPESPQVIVDLGAGCGGASEWLRVSTGATVYAVEPAAGARLAATSAFPQLHVIEGRADETGLPGGVANAVLLSGVTSLLSDIGSVIEEVDRLLAPDGRVAIADLFTSSATTWCISPNVFRSIENLTRTLDHHGFGALSIGCGQPMPDPTWSAAAQAVDDWIDECCTGRAGYREWNVDRQQLRRHVRAGKLMGGCVIAVRRGDAAGDGSASR